MTWAEGSGRICLRAPPSQQSTTSAGWRNSAPVWGMNDVAVRGSVSPRPNHVWFHLVLNHICEVLALVSVQREKGKAAGQINPTLFCLVIHMTPTTTGGLWHGMARMGFWVGSVGYLGSPWVVCGTMCGSSSPAHMHSLDEPYTSLLSPYGWGVGRVGAGSSPHSMA